VSPDHLEVDPPGWFAREELGFAFEHGPSLQWTLATLATNNARAARQLGREAPWRMRLDDKTRGPRPPLTVESPRGARRRGRGVTVT
jgi:hypothetical protein